jgi:hypothetical protein
MCLLDLSPQRDNGREIGGGGAELWMNGEGERAGQEVAAEGGGRGGGGGQIMRDICPPFIPPQDCLVLYHFLVVNSSLIGPSTIPVRSNRFIMVLQ